MRYYVERSRSAHVEDVQQERLQTRSDKLLHCNLNPKRPPSAASLTR